jgi:hypothetical protein
MGTANIIEESGKVLKIRSNLFILGAPHVVAKSTSGVKKALTSLSMNHQQIDKHLRLTLPHQNYFRDTAAELIEHLILTNAGRSTQAFIHIYRMIERIAFVFPMLFAARSTNYTSAFSTLKSYFDDGVQSELKLLRKFQDEAIEQSILDSPIKIDLAHLDQLLIPLIHSTLINNIESGDLSSNTPTEIIFRAGGILSLIIQLRNRFFHYSVSNPKNISILDLGDSDVFFSIINEPAINWIGVIFFYLLESRIE